MKSRLLQTTGNTLIMLSLPQGHFSQSKYIKYSFINIQNTSFNHIKFHTCRRWVRFAIN